MELRTSTDASITAPNELIHASFESRRAEAHPAPHAPQRPYDQAGELELAHGRARQDHALEKVVEGREEEDHAGRHGQCLDEPGHDFGRAPCCIRSRISRCCLSISACCSSIFSCWTLIACSVVRVRWSASARASWLAEMTFWPTMMIGSRTSCRKVWLIRTLTAVQNALLV